MDTDKIISILRQAEHIYSGAFLPDESISSNELVLELDNDQNRLYNAILKTIPQDELSKLGDKLEDGALSLQEKVKWMSEDHPKVKLKPNEPISALLKLYTDKKSKKVGYAKRQLQKRFPYQSYRVQNRILRAFLKGPSTDCDWVGRLLRDNWRQELTKDVDTAWRRNRCQVLAHVVLRHFPVTYVLSEKDVLEQTAGYQHVCARVGNEPGFTVDTSCLSVPDQVYVMAKLGRSIDVEKTEKMIYDYLLSYDKYYYSPHASPSFSNIMGWNRMVWSLGVLGMQDTLVRLLMLKNKTKEAISLLENRQDALPCFVATIKNELAPTVDPNRFKKEIALHRQAIDYEVSLCEDALRKKSRKGVPDSI